MTSKYLDILMHVSGSAKLSEMNIKLTDGHTKPDAAYWVGEPRRVSSHLHNWLNASSLSIPAAVLLACTISFSGHQEYMQTEQDGAIDTRGRSGAHHPSNLFRMCVLGLLFGIGGLHRVGQGPQGSELRENEGN